MNRGTQIIYVPTHANGDVDHPDCEAGFITSTVEDAAFCRYWNKDGSLRTVSSSEKTYFSDLVAKDTVLQGKVKEFFNDSQSND